MEPSDGQASGPDDELLRAALDALDQPLAILTPVRDATGQIADFVCVHVSPAGCASIGMPRERLVGAHLVAQLPMRRRGLFQRLVAVASEGVPFRATEFHLEDDTGAGSGPVRYLDISATRIGEGVVVTWRDVAERGDRSTDAVRDELLFRRAMADSAIGMSVTAPDGTFLRVNEALCRYVGRSREALLTMTWRQLSHPDDIPAEDEDMRRLAAGEIDNYRCTKRYLRADGSVRWADVTVSALRDDRSQLTYCLRQVIDMTEHRELLAAKDEAVQEYRLLADNLSDVVVRLDAQGRIVWASKSLTVAGGWLVSDVLGRPLVDLVHPLDAGPVARALESATAGPPLRCEVRIQDSYEEYRWFSVTVDHIGDEAGRTGWVASWRDIEAEVRARESAAAREAEFRLLAENASDVVVRVAGDGRITWVSPSVEDMLGWQPADMIGARPADCLPTHDVARLEQIVAAMTPGVPQRVSGQVRAADGTYRWFASTGTQIDDGQGRDLGRVIGMRSIDADMAAIRALTRTEALARAAMTSAPGGMAMLDMNRRFMDVNEALSRMLGRDRSWFASRPIVDILAPEDAALDASMRDSLLTGEAQSAVHDKRLVRSDGTQLWVQHAVGLVHDAAGEPLCFVSQFTDITQAKKDAERLEYLASHDTLTRLPNRRAIDIRFRSLLSSRTAPGQAAVVYIDIDGLKLVNDTFGHGVGDRVLVELADRFRSAVRAQDVVARMGGDEFVALLPAVRGSADALLVAEKIKATLDRPMRAIPGHERITVSMGVALLSTGDSVDEVLRRADRALYRAKALGRDRIILDRDPDRSSSDRQAGRL